MTGEHYDIEGLAVPRDMEQLHDLLERASTEHPHIPASDVMMFETAVMELANNVVEHGRPVGQVAWRFSLEVSADSLTARLADSGEEYAGWDAAASHDMPGEMAESGRGLPLASAVLDELDYQRDGASNVWTMVRRWQA
ncbi:ATP-binding protein [Nocardioides pinisoli]|uniref:ATP-binding protein n=1 Tax=Nocardioides pinisoli TaxID=2950279 RepID=A0ABT1L0R4_9ACTN|nr:ATP-binding protein [Nocardioides pinisoli]MCP3423592.1 ATP-binding protein [Nocardioides pinisoli]